MNTIVDDIKCTMECIEEASKRLGYALAPQSYYIEDAGCPHKQSTLPKGYAAVYIFVYESKTKCEFKNRESKCQQFCSISQSTLWVFGSKYIG